MDVPANHFKRAIKAGARRSACGAASPATSRWRSWPARASTGCCSTPSIRPTSCRWSTASCRRSMENKVQPIVRPPWNDQVMIKRFLDAGVQTLLVPMVQTVGGSGAGGGVHPLPAARRARLRLGLALVALRPGQGLPHALRGGDLRAGADRDQAGAGQSGGHRRRRGRRRRVHRAGRPVGRPRLSRRPGQPRLPPGARGRDAADQGHRQGAGHPDRRRGAGAALHRAGLPVHRRRRRLRHPGARLRSSSPPSSEIASPM